MLRFLRIACSATFAIACVMLIALWMRSYWWDDVLAGPILWRNGFSLASTDGRLMLCGQDAEDPVTSWIFDSIRGSSPYAAPKMFLGPVFAFYPSEEDGAYIHVPHWFPALIAGAVAIVLVKRRRFSLRTLLIAITIIAIGLAAIAYYATHADPGGFGGGGGGGLARAEICEIENRGHD